MVIAPETSILIHTGWGSLWDSHDAFNAGEPGIGMAVANWLVELETAMSRTACCERQSTVTVRVRIAFIW